MSLNATEPVQAACLTAPASGGVAVILTVGDREALARLISTRPTFDWNALPENRLKLFRWVAGDGSVLDEVLLHHFALSEGRHGLEISSHGGPRIVQRLLMDLQERGAEIVSADRLATATCRAPEGPVAEALQLLPRAPTRRLAGWLMRNARALHEELTRIRQWIESSQLQKAAAILNALLTRPSRGQRVLEGIRVVLIGEPNAGKSTLANLLAEEERAIVSDTPGTTRDWTDHSISIEGIPLLLIDTAGIRSTDDAIERLAIAHARAQVAAAHLIVRVLDRSVQADSPEEAGLTDLAASETAHVADLLVWNKADLPEHPTRAKIRERWTGPQVTVCAIQGRGLETLRRELLRLAGYEGWPTDQAELFTPRQRNLLHDVLSAVNTGEASTALDTLARLTQFSPEG